MPLEKDRAPFGQAFAGELERYLEESLHDRVRVEALDEAIPVPTFLDHSYTFYKASIFGRRCVLIAAGEDIATPTQIAKHVSLVRSAADTVVIFAAPSLSARNRSRLIAQGVAFVVPGNQLYIPDLAMDLREHFRVPKPRATDTLSPVAQAVLFHHLLRLDKDQAIPSVIAKRLRYSPMSIGRAFDDLIAAGLAVAEKRGKEKHLHFYADRRALLDSARPLLRSPVRTVKHIGSCHRMPSLKLAGETALADMTDLSRPKTKTFAVAASEWKAVAETCKLIEVHEFEEDFAVETWSYDPAGLSDGPLVDPLSLYAQFRDHHDERVSMAAASLLETLSW